LTFLKHLKIKTTNNPKTKS